MMVVDKEKCIGCKLCEKDCTINEIEMIDNKAYIKNERCFKCGHCIAICPKNAVYCEDYDMNDVKEYNKEDYDIESEKLLNFIKFRRTIRKFKDKDIEKNIIEKIIDAGRFTPTGGNSQNVSYVVIKDNIDEIKNATIETLNSMGEYILNNLTPENMGLQLYANLWVKMYKDYKVNPKEGDRLFFNAPAVIAVVSDSEVNASLASSSMELMTNALGLGCVYNGFFVRACQNNNKIKELLGLKENEKIVTCMVIGYPDVKYLRTVPRKDAQITWK